MKHIKRKSWAVAVALGLGAMMGCQVDLPVASQIEHMRVLGAVTEVEGDAERASPAPGETAHVTWSIVFQDPQKDNSELASLFFVCTAPEQFSGTPVCQEFVDVALGGSISNLLAGIQGREALDCGETPDRTVDYGPFRAVCVTGTPKLDVQIPEDSSAQAKLLRGVICRNGIPRFDENSPTGMSCDPLDSADAEDVEDVSVYGTVPIQYGEKTENQNPDVEAVKLFFHEPPLPWEPSSDDLTAELNDESCTDLAYDDRVMSTDGHEESVTLRYDADARELFEGEPETLTFSSYSTFGKLSARFTLFRSDAETPLSRTLTWELTPEERRELNKKSKLVRFYFTVLDGRGGYAVTSRDLCIVRR